MRLCGLALCVLVGFVHHREWTPRHTLHSETQHERISLIALSLKSSCWFTPPQYGCSVRHPALSRLPWAADYI